MSSKQQYQSILDDMNVLEDQFDLSVALISSLDDGSEVFPNTSEIYTQIASIKSWGSGKINEIEKQEMLEGFLAGMRGLFIEYGAKLEIVTNNSVGYGEEFGESYGAGEAGVGFKLTIEKNSLQTEKLYDTMILQGNNI